MGTVGTYTVEGLHPDGTGGLSGDPKHPMKQFTADTRIVSEEQEAEARARKEELENAIEQIANALFEQETAENTQTLSPSNTNTEDQARINSLRNELIELDKLLARAQKEQELEKGSLITPTFSTRAKGGSEYDYFPITYSGITEDGYSIRISNSVTVPLPQGSSEGVLNVRVPKVAGNNLLLEVISPDGSANTLVEFNANKEGGITGDPKDSLTLPPKQTLTQSKITSAQTERNRIAEQISALGGNTPESEYKEESPKFTPDISIVAVTGNNIIFSVQSPYDSSYVYVQGGGLLGAAELTHKGGTGIAFSHVTFKTSNTPGEYSLILHESNGGKKLASAALHWNGRSFSPVSEENTWSPERIAQSMARSGITDMSKLSENIQTAQERLNLFAMQAGLDLDSVKNSQLIGIEQSRLYEDSKFFISPEELHRRIFELRPEWLPGDNFNRLITQAWENGGRTSTMGQTEDSLIKQRNAYFEEKTSDLHKFESIMSQLLYKAIVMLQKIQKGQNEGALWEEFSSSVKSANLQGFSRIPGLAIPIASGIMDEAVILFFKHTDELAENMAAQGRIDNRENRRMNDPNVGGSGTVDVSEYVASLPAETDRRQQHTQWLNEYYVAAGIDVHAANILIARGDTSVNSNRLASSQNNLLALQNSTYSLVQANTSKTRNSSPGSIVAYVSAELASLGDLVEMMNEQAIITGHREASESTQSSGSLDRWYATVGETINVTWTVGIEESGQYEICVDGLNDWISSQTSITANGQKTNLNSAFLGSSVSDRLNLSSGAQRITIANLKASADAGVNKAHFYLRKYETTPSGLVTIFNITPETKKSFHTMFIADHEERFDESTQFRISGVDGEQPVTITGVTALVNYFAPILHYHKDERFAVPFSIENIHVANTGASDAEIDLSKFSPENDGGTHYNQISI